MSENKVIWHLYPQEKPREGGKYLITVRFAGKNYIETDLYYINEKHRYFLGNNPYVIAWAKMPEPYEGGL